MSVKDSTKVKLETVIAALKAADGKVYLAASAMGVAPTTVYQYAKRYKTVQQVIEDARGELVDLAETALKTAVLTGEAWAVCFTLKTLGKKRGYVERQEIDLLALTKEQMDAMSDDELKRIAES